MNRRRWIVGCAAVGAFVLAAGSVAADEPVEIGLYDTGPGALHGTVRVVGKVAYLAKADFVHVVDVSDPTDPSQLGFVGVDLAGTLEVVGSRVFTAEQDQSATKILDVSDPTAPVVLGEWLLPLPGAAFGLEVVGNLVYLAADEQGLRILDVSDPTNIVELGFLDPLQAVGTVAVAGHHAYLSVPTGVLVVDVSNPALPASVDTLAVAGALGVDVSGGHLYVVGDDFRIFDVSNTALPVEVGSLGQDGRIVKVSAVDGLAYLSTGALFDSSVVILDVSDVTAPSELASIPVSSVAAGADGGRDLVFAPDSLIGLRIFRLPAPPPLPIFSGPIALAILFAGWRALRRGLAQ